MEIVADNSIPGECPGRILDYGGDKLEPELAAKLWIHILRHKWFLSEQLGRDVGIKVACLDYIENTNSIHTALEETERDHLLKELGVRLGEEFNSIVQEHGSLDSIRETFGPYLSTEVVNEILKSPGGEDLTGELREITILVSDIREFTRTTELLEPVGSRDGATNRSSGFHPLPHQTVREVLPHTAFRQPSSSGIQG